MPARRPDFAIPDGSAALARIALVAVACAALGGVYALVAPKWYAAEIVVVPARPPAPGISELAGGIGGLLGVLDQATTAGSADVSRFVEILRSNAVSDVVIERFGLRARYRERYQESAREVLWRRCGVKVMARPDLVRLTCEDRDPRVVVGMLSAFAEEGNAVVRRAGRSTAAEEVSFCERRVAELRREAAGAAARTREFQERHDLFDVDTQARGVVAELSALSAEAVSRQLALGYARTFSSSDEGTVRRLRSELAALGEEMRDLESPAAGPPAPGSDRAAVFPSAAAMPALRAQLENLLRDRKLAEASLVSALQRLEAARAAVARDVSTFVVLAPPSLPTRPSRPRQLGSVGVAAVLGAGVGVLLELRRSLRRAVAAGGA